MILKSKPMSYTVDPISASQFLDCLDVLLPTLSHIANDSLMSDSFPSEFKHAVVKPLLKT